MKKVLSIVLAIAMIATMSVVAFAETKTIDKSAPAEFQVGATYVPDAGKDVYSVDVTWANGSFEYTQGGLIWDPATHAFIDDPEGTEGAWNFAGDITVVNHSSEKVNVTVDFVTAVDGVDVTFTEEAFELATGEGLAYAEADSKTVSVKTVTGEIEAETDNLGKIVVAIA